MAADSAVNMLLPSPNDHLKTFAPVVVFLNSIGVPLQPLFKGVATPKCRLIVLAFTATITESLLDPH